LSRIGRRLVVAAAVLLSLYGAGIGLLYANQRSLIFPAPDHAWPAEPNYQDITYRTSDGLTLRGLYRPAAPGRPTILFFHGNGDSLSGSLVSVEAYAAQGYGVLLPEYRGYGGNPGKPTEEGLYSDARAARDWLDREGVAADSQILIGCSLGSGVATQLALERQPASLILISAYTSLPDVVTDRFAGLVPAELVKDQLATASKIARIKTPVLIMHDRDDPVIPVAHGQRLAGLANGSSLLLFSGYGHQLGFAKEVQQAGLTWLAERGLR
jgi:fermentation-respiration switch protein FrsA (DUF1100 family)